jgi:molecular chaperone GrpE
MRLIRWIARLLRRFSFPERGTTTARNRKMMAETHHDRTGVPPRGGSSEDRQAGEGDSPVDASPPNADATQPPADDIVEDGGGRGDPDGDGGAGSDVDTDTVALADQVDRLQREVAAAQDRYLRIAAEFDNYRRRVDRERADLPARAKADVVKALLEVIDDLDRVAEYDADTPAESLLEGVRLVDLKLNRLVGTWGLVKVDPTGEPFDPNTMEAVAAVPAEHPEEDDVVLDVFQRGYRLGDTLVRPARVRVKKHDG